jgi:acetoin:2,6-dichlorophenolindophenol oxidoreductase subunit beta
LEVFLVKIRMRQAVLQALDDALAEDAGVILLGEDIAAAGGPFKCTDGLLGKYGADRIIDTPISEMGFMGAAVGAAACGLRPVVEMMFIEFIGVALDQLTTQAATLRYLSRGRLAAPLVMRASVGAGQGFGCQHSQILDHWFRGTPGLKVCMPSGSRSAYGLLRAAIDDPDPVIVLEPRILYGEHEEFELDPKFRVPLGEAEIVRPGKDVTLVAAGAMTQVALKAAKSAAVDIEVIDLLSLSPWDKTTIGASLARTGRLVTVEEAPRGAGWGADVVATLASECFGSFKAPPHRITMPDAPIPHAGELEALCLPSPEYVATQVDALVRQGAPPLPWWREAA